MIKMGHDKEWAAKKQMNNWKAPIKYVCANCVEDYFLKNIIAKNLAKITCNYCGKSSQVNIAAPVESIMGPIETGLSSLFVDGYGTSGLPDGGSTLKNLPSTAEALRKIPLECHKDLLHDAADAFECDKWDKYPLSFDDPGRSMQLSWETFSRTVKHSARFFFSSIEPRVQFSFIKSPSELLEGIGKIVLELELIKPLPAESILFRARHWPADEDWCLLDIDKNLGAPPNEKTKSQRMNTAGISYLYLAKDRATALAEVLNKPPCQAVVGTFKVFEELTVLDLSQLPNSPSPFDKEYWNKREFLIFLDYFIQEISKPVQKDDQEHIEYVPSQVVCEYFAKVFRTTEKRPIDGLVYQSAICPGGINVVLFPPQQRDKEFSDLVSLSGAEQIEFPNWIKFSNAIRYKSEN